MWTESLFITAFFIIEKIGSNKMLNSRVDK